MKTASTNDTRVISFADEYEIQQFRYGQWYRSGRELKTRVKIPRTARAEAIKRARKDARDFGGRYLGCFKHD